MGLTKKYFNKNYSDVEEFSAKDVKKAFHDGLKIGRKIANSVWRKFPELPKFKTTRKVVIFIAPVEKFDVQPTGEAKLLITKFKDVVKWCYLDEMMFEKFKYEEQDENEERTSD